MPSAHAVAMGAADAGAIAAEDDAGDRASGEVTELGGALDPPRVAKKIAAPAMATAPSATPAKRSARLGAGPSPAPVPVDAIGEDGDAGRATSG